MAFTIAFKIVRNREDAEEIAQDAFVKAYQSLRSFKGESKFSTWLYRIVYNAAISHTRRHRFEFTVLDEAMTGNITEDEIFGSLDVMDPEERSQLVTAAVDKLLPEESALVSLFYMEDNSIEDISQITGLSVSNVKVRLHRIRRKLYDSLQPKMAGTEMAQMM